MQRSHRILLIVGKLVVVGLLILWLYSRTETEMRGDRVDVASARGQLTAAAPGGPAAVEMTQARAAEFYDLVKQGTWTGKGEGPSRGTVEIVYATGAADRLEITGPDRVLINGSTRKVDPQLLQTLLLASRARADEPTRRDEPDSRPAIP